MQPESRQRWSAETDKVLRDAGWRPGRKVSTVEWERTLADHGGFRIHPAAREFLAEFGGLEVGARGPGRTMAKLAFRLDPVAAEWDDEIFEVLSDEAGTYLFPIGEADRRNSYLGMAADGKVYIGMDTVSLFAADAEEALEKLVEGIQ
ncbi:hypothetical protein JOF56_006645 [Kibdelosporangium banguiense]|uniref:SUKH-3 immunity protein n=1 Tax=Kibdelosporangium banguiense TaxID=1365924 RepID=A0ABS4TPD3_9PSEU|nr:SUKH-3 domain-containing protein [Kibdelosporangium banguiense]MBP2326260.1 hypothetical protein [Kibdelosporangium banguiense]